MGQRQIDPRDYPPGVVGTPCITWMWTKSAQSFLSLALPPGSGVHFEWGGSTIAFKRNRIAAMTLNNERRFEWLCFLDSDMTFDPDVIFRLLDTGLDLVGGRYVNRDWEADHIAAGHLNDNVPSGLTHVEREQMGEKPIPVDWLGTGCMLIRRRVLEALANEQGAPGFVATGDGIGEDIHFCKRARELGFQPYLDPRVVCGHVNAVAVMPGGS